MNSHFLHNAVCIRAEIWAIREYEVYLAFCYILRTYSDRILKLLIEVLKEGNNPDRTRTLPGKAPGLLRRGLVVCTKVNGTVVLLYTFLSLLYVPVAHQISVWYLNFHIGMAIVEEPIPTKTETVKTYRYHLRGMTDKNFPGAWSWFCGVFY